MDPTANLEEQMELAQRMLTSTFSGSDAMRLAELVDALNTWLAKGGFLPRQWKNVDKVT